EASCGLKDHQGDIAPLEALHQLLQRLGGGWARPALATGAQRHIPASLAHVDSDEFRVLAHSLLRHSPPRKIVGSGKPLRSWARPCWIRPRGGLATVRACSDRRLPHGDPALSHGFRRTEAETVYRATSPSNSNPGRFPCSKRLVRSVL